MSSLKISDLRMQLEEDMKANNANDFVFPGVLSYSECGYDGRGESEYLIIVEYAPDEVMQTNYMNLSKQCRFILPKEDYAPEADDQYNEDFIKDSAEMARKEGSIYKVYDRSGMLEKPDWDIVAMKNGNIVRHVSWAPTKEDAMAKAAALNRAVRRTAFPDRMNTR